MFLNNFTGVKICLNLGIKNSIFLIIKHFLAKSPQEILAIVIIHHLLKFEYHSTFPLDMKILKLEYFREFSINKEKHKKFKKYYKTCQILPLKGYLELKIDPGSHIKKLFIL